jgi:hypothetical protein
MKWPKLPTMVTVPATTARYPGHDFADGDRSVRWMYWLSQSRRATYGVAHTKHFGYVGNVLITNDLRAVKLPSGGCQPRAIECGPYPTTRRIE